MKEKEVYPEFSENNLQLSMFENIFQSKIPTIHNCPTYLINKSIEMEDTGMFADVIMSQNVMEDIQQDDIIDDSTSREEQQISQSQMNVKGKNIYHTYNTYVKEICKYVGDEDHIMLRYLNLKMGQLVSDCIKYYNNDFNVEDEIKLLTSMDEAENGKSEKGNTIEVSNEKDDNNDVTIEKFEYEQFSSSLPPIGYQKQSTRFKSNM